MKGIRLMVVLMVCLSLGLFQLAFSQGSIKAGIEGNVALPSGDWSDFAGTGFGGTAFLVYGAAPNLAITGHAGYLTFGGEEVGDAEYDFSMIPILAGGRYYFSMPGSPIKPFVEGQVGFHIFRTTFTGEQVTGFDPNTFQPITEEVDETTSETEFSFAPTVGVEFSSIEASAFYMLISDANYIGVRVSYGFPLVP